ncbi:hypothetical protein MGYG_08984 [Nannizzia gypsea CBS 118893]|uniref:HNH nuclease domain-containing protein n=1 Tax=Arthroderma gypseum (strain ATCC MYA-4604 / CBS 118893) TaxID=535722 RepID=E4UMZ5_ARTGP|nr:hypothetical protein MGYG_08984 [Nannizzia gypsea CBS 118893]EFQ99509.1 hypothetical protein MGYG_08984 [Nannizzia gypsea CBS 118893]
MALPAETTKETPLLEGLENSFSAPQVAHNMPHSPMLRGRDEYEQEALIEAQGLSANLQNKILIIETMVTKTHEIAALAIEYYLTTEPTNMNLDYIGHCQTNPTTGIGLSWGILDWKTSDRQRRPGRLSFPRRDGQEGISLRRRDQMGYEFAVGKIVEYCEHVAHIIPHSLMSGGSDEQELGEAKKLAITILNIFNTGIIYEIKEEV